MGERNGGGGGRGREVGGGLEKEGMKERGRGCMFTVSFHAVPVVHEATIGLPSKRIMQPLALSNKAVIDSVIDITLTLEMTCELDVCLAFNFPTYILTNFDRYPATRLFVSLLVCSFVYFTFSLIWEPTPQWGTAEAEIKNPPVENPQLEGSPFKPEQIRISPCMLRLLPGISSLLISTLSVHSSAFCPKPLPSFSCVNCG